MSRLSIFILAIVAIAVLVGIGWSALYATSSGLLIAEQRGTVGNEQQSALTLRCRYFTAITFVDLEFRQPLDTSIEAGDQPTCPRIYRFSQPSGKPIL
ncbi:MAG: hypothetical protein ABFS23_02415 [Pseudomonadota bacterium]